MKKIIVAVLFLFSPAFAFAQSFEADVSYGMKGDAVLEVQEFLGTQGCFSGPYTGNFYSLTLAGVKCFQSANGIRSTGYFGPLSRAKALEIVAASKADDEVSTTTPIVIPEIPSKPSMVFTLPNGTVISIAPDGTITTLYTPPAPQASSTSSTPVQDQPAQQTPTTPVQQTPPAQPEPFVRSGSVSASVSSKAAAVDRGATRPVIAEISITNGTNETMLFTNIIGRVAISNATIALPSIDATVRNVEISSDTRGVKPGETVLVRYSFTSSPASTGTFDLSLSSFALVGQTSGDILSVGGFPLSLGTFEIR